MLQDSSWKRSSRPTLSVSPSVISNSLNSKLAERGNRRTSSEGALEQGGRGREGELWWRQQMVTQPQDTCQISAPSHSSFPQCVVSSGAKFAPSYSPLDRSVGQMSDRNWTKGGVELFWAALSPTTTRRKFTLSFFLFCCRTDEQLDISKRLPFVSRKNRIKTRACFFLRVCFYGVRAHSFAVVVRVFYMPKYDI